MPFDCDVLSAIVGTARRKAPPISVVGVYVIVRVHVGVTIVGMIGIKTSLGEDDDALMVVGGEWLVWLLCPILRAEVENAELMF